MKKLQGHQGPFGQGCQCKNSAYAQKFLFLKLGRQSLLERAPHRYTGGYHECSSIQGFIKRVLFEEFMMNTLPKCHQGCYLCATKRDQGLASSPVFLFQVKQTPIAQSQCFSKGLTGCIYGLHCPVLKPPRFALPIHCGFQDSTNKHFSSSHGLETSVCF